MFGLQQCLEIVGFQLMLYIAVIISREFFSTF